jgi:hypothetical protein
VTVQLPIVLIHMVLPRTNSEPFCCTVAQLLRTPSMSYQILSPKWQWPLKRSAQHKVINVANPHLVYRDTLRSLFKAVLLLLHACSLSRECALEPKIYKNWVKYSIRVLENTACVG